MQREVIKVIKTELFTVKVWSDGSEEYELTEKGRKNPPLPFISDGIVHDRFILGPPVPVVLNKSLSETTPEEIEQQARLAQQSKELEKLYGCKGHLETIDQRKLRNEVGLGTGWEYDQRRTQG